MPRETKSNGQKDIYDRFYTPDTTVDKCLSLLDLNAYDLIIEPSAGNGSFSKKIPNCLAFDIAPAAKGITCADWLAIDKTQFKGNHILVCGNPPFGEQGRKAIAFFNSSADFCHTIAFILPLSFKKISIQNNLNLFFHLKHEFILEDNTFYLGEKNINVPCVFQIWEKQKAPREKVVFKTTSSLFEFTTPEYADFRVQRVGGNAGHASLDLNRAASSNYFLKNLSNMSTDDFITLINNLTFPTISYTVGPKSLPKGELIYIIEENFPKGVK